MPVLWTPLTALAVTAFLTAVLIRIAPFSGLVVAPSERRWHREPTPTAGGLAIAAGFVVAVLTLPRANDSAANTLVLALIGVLGALALGLFDDAAVLRPRTKLTLEILVASFLATVGPSFNLVREPALDWALTMFWLLVTMNAVNLIDGIDGLAGSLGAISAAAIAAIAGMHNHSSATIWPLSLLGSVLGFLVFNTSPAKIFMGDAGSLFIGAILGVLSIQVSGTESIPVFVGFALPILLLMVPVLDTMTVTVIRIAHGRPISCRGLDHSHHRLARLGLSDSRVVWALCALQAAACLAAVELSVAPAELAVLTMPFVAIPFALVGLFLTDQSFDAQGPGALQGLPVVARVLLSLGYKRRLVEVGLDVLLVTAGYFGASMLRLNFQLTYSTVSSLLHGLPIVVGAAMAALFATGTYRGIWRYTAVADALRFAEGATLSGILVFAAALMVPIRYDPAVAVMFAVLLFNLLGLTRLSFHFFHRIVQTLATPRPRVLIVGGDSEGAEAARHLFLDPARRVTLLGFVDNDALKLGKLIHGFEVLGSLADLDRIFDQHPFEELLVASSSLTRTTIIMLREFAHRRSVVMCRFVFGVARIEESEAPAQGVVSDQQELAAQTERAREGLIAVSVLSAVRNPLRGY